MVYLYIMRKDKERILALRREGRTYREIARDTGVSRATLSRWLGADTLSSRLRAIHTEEYRKQAADCMKHLNLVRRLKLQYAYALLESEAQAQYDVYSKEIEFWKGILLYEGHGDMKSKHYIRLSSGKSEIQVLFLEFCERYLGIKRSDVRITLALPQSADLGKSKEFWANALQVDDTQFYKNQQLKGKITGDELQYGVAVSIISNTGLKKKLCKWIESALKMQS